MRVILALSCTGAADISLIQSFVAPSSKDEVGTSCLSVGYAFIPDLRCSTEIELQNSKIDKDNRY
ncbi:MAG: hypothetical protein QNJ65_17530 [Xenococcaceae cyanobacterium MO_234.B1]|nr:hypothetical protein [Xenococcaceae cyanobacterium MO_234.B1]